MRCTREYSKHYFIAKYTMERLLWDMPFFGPPRVRKVRAFASCKTGTMCDSQSVILKRIAAYEKRSTAHICTYKTHMWQSHECASQTLE